MRRWFRLPRTEQTLAREIDDEIAFHIEARVAELVASGEPEAEARRRAALEFGDVDGARAELASIDRVTLDRERRASLRESAAHDVRAAVRSIRRSPGFTTAVVLTLALGAGVNAAMFGITDRLLLSAPPHIQDAEEVVRVLYEHTPSSGERTVASALPYPDYLVFRSVPAFDEVGAFFVSRSVLGRGAASSEIRLGQATATLFPLLGVEPAVGRFFSPEEDAVPAGVPVVVLGHSLWQQAFGGDTEVLGRVIELDHRRYEVIGVAPRGFNGVNLEPVDAWVPVSALGPYLGGEEWYAFRGMHYLQVIARLRGGVDSAMAREQARAAFLAANEGRFAGDETAGVLLGSVIAARSPAVGDDTAQRSGRIALLLLGVSLLVAIIACVNVLNLLLARGVRQRREIGVRLALGVSHGRLAAQGLTETLLLALLGGFLALLLAHWAGRLAWAVLLPELGWTVGRVSARVAAVAGAITLVCALVAGTGPVLHAARTHVTGLLGLAGRTTLRRSRMRTGLVSFQATLSIVLLAGAGLFLRSLREAGQIALGYEPERVAMLTWHTSGLEWSRERTLSLYDRSLERVQSLPQVASAALTMTAPLWSRRYGAAYVPGTDTIPTTRDIIFSPVSTDYFRAIGARILDGRAFDDRDVSGSPAVAIVTESLARVLWPGERALGKCFMTSREPGEACRAVVGVVEDTRYSGVFEDPALMYYLPMSQVPGPGTMRALLVRLRRDDEAGLATVRAALQSLEPGLPHIRAQLLEEIVAPALQPWRLGAAMFTAFGILALVLASLGLYSVVAYDVAQRRRELGVRLALGARAGGVLRMVLTGALRIVGIGLLGGLAISAVLGRRIEPLLFDVSARDPGVHAAVALLLLTVAVLAAALPAWRAARVQPTEALRDDN